MKKWSLILILLICTSCMAIRSTAQCSICTKTSMQQGEKAGKGMNGGIIYLMLMPLAIIGIVGFRWWQQEKIA